MKLPRFPRLPLLIVDDEKGILDSTADLLHVAMMEFGFDHFVTADHQQHQFALAAGYTSVLLPP